MLKERCRICRRGYTATGAMERTPDYILTFDDGVCELCCVTLVRAMEGITELLRQSHGEKRERVIDRLAHKLESNGFEVGAAFARRRKTA